MPDTTYATLEEAAAELDRTAEQVYALIRGGELVGIKTQDGRWLVRRVNVTAYAAGEPQSHLP